MTEKKVASKGRIKDKTVKTENLFSKEQILSAKRFKNRRDMLSAILYEDKRYTMQEVEQLMKDFLKGQVK